jgi:excisionase family DNA binding protein
MDQAGGQDGILVRGVSMITSIGPLTAREVAMHLGVHYNTVKRIPASELPYFRFGARGDRRYRIEDVERYIETRHAV